MKQHNSITNNKGLSISIGSKYWTHNIFYIPIEVKILSLDCELKKAKLQQGWIDIDNLYPTESECPKR